MFGLRYAGLYLQLSNVKTTQSAQADRQVIYKSKGGTSKGIGNLSSAFEKADRLLEQKLIKKYLNSSGDPVPLRMELQQGRRRVRSEPCRPPGSCLCAFYTDGSWNRGGHNSVSDPNRVVSATCNVAGLARKNPPKQTPKNPPKKPTKNVFWGFFLGFFLVFFWFFC